MSLLHPRQTDRLTNVNGNWAYTRLSGGGVLHACTAEVRATPVALQANYLMVFDTRGVRTRATFNVVKSILDNTGIVLTHKHGKWWIDKGDETFQYHDGIMVDTRTQTIMFSESSAAYEDTYLQLVGVFTQKVEKYLLVNTFAPKEGEKFATMTRYQIVNLVNKLDPTTEELGLLIANAVRGKWGDVADKLSKSSAPLVKLVSEYVRSQLGLAVW